MILPTRRDLWRRRCYGKGEKQNKTYNMTLRRCLTLRGCAFADQVHTICKYRVEESLLKKSILLLFVSSSCQLDSIAYYSLHDFSKLSSRHPRLLHPSPEPNDERELNRVALENLCHVIKKIQTK